jgi:serine/threonine protein kinase
VACLDETTLTAYFSFGLKPAETDALFRHIDQCAACAQRFTEVVAALRTQDLSQPKAEGKSSSPMMLGRYHVERLLGMGGMGVVYAGYDPELQRKVAIKLLQPDSKLTVGTVRGRLMREAQAMARLSHPNVINVFEVGTFGEQVFVVMELIDGTTLAGWLREKQRTWREIVSAFLAAGSGLEAAHRAGIIHRDFKPDNVLVGKDGRICVTDFGLARRIEAEEEAAGPSPVSPIDATVTRSGLLVGTPAYMAPEQMRGEPTDERSDVFSFCVALYEALYGTRPFLGGNLEQLRSAVESGRIEAPRRMTGPRRLYRALLRGVKSAPSQRPSSLAPLLAELRRDPARRWRQVGLALLVAVAAGGISIAVLRKPAAPCTGAAGKLVGVWDGARKQALEAHAPALADDLRAMTAALDERARAWTAMRSETCEATRVRGEQSEELLDRRMQCLDERLRELGALVDVLLGADEPTLRRGPEAIAHLEPLARCSDAVSLSAAPQRPRDPAAQKRLDEIDDLIARAAALRTTGKYEEGAKLARQSVASARGQSWTPALAASLFELGRAEDMLGHFDLAVQALEEAVRLAEETSDDRLVARSFIQLAGVEEDRQLDLKQGWRWLNLAEGQEKRLGERAAVSLERLRVAMLLHNSAGDVTQAATVARQGLALAEKTGDLPTQALFNANLGMVLINANQNQEAEAVLQRALTLYAQTVGSAHPKIADAYQYMSSAEDNLGHLDSSIEWLNRAIDMYRRTSGKSYPQLGMALGRLAEKYYAAGRKLEAIAPLQEALEIFEKLDNKFWVPMLRGRLGVVYVELERYQEAIPLLERTIPETRFEVPIDKFALAKALWATGGDRRRAVKLVEEALAAAGGPKPDESAVVNVADFRAWLKSHH